MIKEKIEPNQLDNLITVVVEAMKEKKAEGITILDMRKLRTRVADVFIICHGDNDRQVEAIAHSVEDDVEENLHERVWHREGFENKEWILLDYINLVVHVFLTEKREFYALEELWGDAEITHIKDTNHESISTGF